MNKLTTREFNISAKMVKNGVLVLVVGLITVLASFITADFNTDALYNPDIYFNAVLMGVLAITVKSVTTDIVLEKLELENDQYVLAKKGINDLNSEMNERRIANEIDDEIDLYNLKNRYKVKRSQIKKEVQKVDKKMINAQMKRNIAKYDEYREIKKRLTDYSDNLTDDDVRHVKCPIATRSNMFFDNSVDEIENYQYNHFKSAKSGMVTTTLVMSCLGLFVSALNTAFTSSVAGALVKLSMYILTIGINITLTNIKAKRTFNIKTIPNVNHKLTNLNQMFANIDVKQKKERLFQ